MNPFDQAWIVLKMGAVGRGTGNPRRPNAGTRTKWAREIHNLMREHDKVGRVIDHTNKDSGYRHAAGMIIHHPDDKDMIFGWIKSDLGDDGFRQLDNIVAQGMREWLASAAKKIVEEKKDLVIFIKIFHPDLHRGSLPSV